MKVQYCTGLFTKVIILLKTSQNALNLTFLRLKLISLFQWVHPFLGKIYNKTKKIKMHSLSELCKEIKNWKKSSLKSYLVGNPVYCKNWRLVTLYTVSTVGNPVHCKYWQLVSLYTVNTVGNPVYCKYCWLPCIYCKYCW